MQIDFGEHKTQNGLKLYIFAAVLSRSRYKFIAFQDSVMVVAEDHGDIIYTKDFKYFIQEMGLRMYVCRKADPETKGKVENTVGYVKKNFLSVRDFITLEEAQGSLEKWLIRRANRKISQAAKLIPAEVIEEEREHLRPIKNSICRKETLIGREERKADENALI